jgi:hypothetical protein
MWTCNTCGEQNSTHFVKCIKCGYLRDGSPPEGVSRETTVSTAFASSDVSQKHQQTQYPINSRKQILAFDLIQNRYSAAYRLARGLAFLGRVITWVGILLAIIIVVGGVIANRTVGSLALLISLVSAGLLMLITFGLGGFVAAQSQVMLALIDTAVNTSPLLSKSDVSRIISNETLPE